MNILKIKIFLVIFIINKIFFLKFFCKSQDLKKTHVVEKYFKLK